MNIGRSPTASKYSYSLLHIAIKKGEKTHTVYLSKKKALSFFERASERRLGVFALSPLFTFRNLKTINALTISQIELETTFHYKKRVFLQT